MPARGAPQNQIILLAREVYLVESGLPRENNVLICYSLWGKRGAGIMICGAIITAEGEIIQGKRMRDVIILGKIKRKIDDFSS